MAYTKQNILSGVTVGSFNFIGAADGQVLISDANGEMTPGEFPAVDPALPAADGSAAAPTIGFVDGTKGFYGIGANAIGASVGGVHAVAIDAYRNLVVGATAGTARFQVIQGTAGVGTVSVNGTAVTGTGTQFTNTFKVGDTITVTTTSGAETKAITAVTSNTLLATASFAGTAAAGTAYTLAGGTRLSVLGNGNMGIGLGATLPTCLLQLPHDTAKASVRIGSFSFQSYALNNCWMGDNIYYDGGFRAIEAGYQCKIQFSSGIATMSVGGSVAAGGAATMIDALGIDRRGNVHIGAGVTTNGSAYGNLVLYNSTGPSDHTDDQISIYAKDASTGGSTLAIWTECAVESIGTFTATHKHKKWINGTEYWVALDAV
jgi:hypothetical protein